MEIPRDNRSDDRESLGVRPADFELKFGGYMIFAAVLIVVVLLPLSPPTEAIDSEGWLVAGAMVILAMAGGTAMFTAWGKWTYGRLLAVTYVSLAMLGVMT